MQSGDPWHWFEQIRWDSILNKNTSLFNKPPEQIQIGFTTKIKYRFPVQPARLEPSFENQMKTSAYHNLTMFCHTFAVYVVK